jgi:hypothetical protein
MTDLVTGDTGSRLVCTVKDKSTGTARNLTGAAVKLRWRDNDRVVVTKTATVTDAAGGVCEYVFGAGEIIAPSMKIEVEVTDNTGKVTTSVDTIDLTVREEIG